MDIIEYFPPKASYFLVVSPEDCRSSLVGLDGAQEKSRKQEGRGQGTTFKRIKTVYLRLGLEPRCWDSNQVKTQFGTLTHVAGTGTHSIGFRT